MTMDLYISIHIPKTGGTSFLHTLESVFGERLQTDYSAGDKPNWLTAERPNPSLEDLKSTRCIHGHFSAGKFLHLREREDLNPIFMTWIRHPVERTLSVYHYLRSKPVPRKGPTPPWEQAAKSMALVDFLESDGNWKNFQTRALSGLSPHEVDFIGVTEHFEQCIDRLQNSLFKGVDLPIVHERRNEGRGGAFYNVPTEVRSYIESHCAEDMDLFYTESARYV